MPPRLASRAYPLSYIDGDWSADVPLMSPFPPRRGFPQAEQTS